MWHLPSVIWEIRKRLKRWELKNQTHEIIQFPITFMNNLFSTIWWDHNQFLQVVYCNEHCTEYSEII